MHSTISTLASITVKDQQDQRSSETSPRDFTKEHFPSCERVVFTWHRISGVNWSHVVKSRKTGVRTGQFFVAETVPPADTIECLADTDSSVIIQKDLREVTVQKLVQVGRLHKREFMKGFRETMRSKRGFLRPSPKKLQPLLVLLSCLRRDLPAFAQQVELCHTFLQ